MTSSQPVDPKFPSKRAVDLQQNFACPVCRAHQPAQPECRRCSADLALYIKALRSIEQARQQLESANDRGDTQLADQTSSYLSWLTKNLQVQTN